MWKGGNESECLLSAQEGHFEGSLDLKGEEVNVRISSCHKCHWIKASYIYSIVPTIAELQYKLLEFLLTFPHS